MTKTLSPHKADLTESSTGCYVWSGFGDKVRVGISGREFSSERHSNFLKKLKVNEEDFASLKQIHSPNLVGVKRKKMPRKDIRADGMICSEKGIALGIVTADCVPVIVYDAEKHVAAIAHSGWRGIHHGIIKKTVQAVCQNFSTHPASLKFLFGPCIRKCCYEVGEEFREYFPHCYEADRENLGKGKMDLVGAIIEELESSGVSAEQIYDTGFCTVCDNDRFFSARHENATLDRTLSVIQLL